MSKLKLLALCDAPTTTSGFARVAANLLRRWSAEADIDVWGVGFVGWGYRRAPYVETMFPAGVDWASPAKLQLFLAQLKTGGYTHVWLMQDTFLLSSGDFPAQLRAVCRARGIYSTLYFPVDAPLDPAWTDIIAAVDCPIAYTAYGAEQAKTQGERRGYTLRCEILPHGVDTNVYLPLADRAALRRTLWAQEWVKPDDFLMINVNANQRRKDVARSLEVLQAVQHAGVPAKLLMHMPESSGEGLSLMAVGDQLGLHPVTDWGHSDPYYRKGHALLGEADLAKFYNVADLYLSTSLGEGWGLGITEAVACGCPAAVPLHTACRELLERLNPMLAHHPKEQPRLIGLPLERGGVVCDYDNSRVRYRVDVAGAAQRIAAYYVSGEWRERPELTPLAEQWLSWDRIASKMMRLMKRQAGVRRAAAVYLEYGGGLGDVLSQLFYRNSYSYLDGLKPGQRAEVAVLSHNPFVKELFQWHPRRSQIDLVDCGYWHGAEEDRKCRRKFGLPPPGMLSRLPVQPEPAQVTFYPSPEDRKILDDILRERERPLVVLALAAGLPERNIPLALAQRIITRLEAAGYRLALTGRTFERHGRQEFRPTGPWVTDLVDQLSVPGTCALVQASAGLVTCHSALNLLAWHLRKPQLLLYPQSVWERHIRRPDQWAFGIGYPETVHAVFDGEMPPGAQLVDRFVFELMTQQPLGEAPATASPAAGETRGQ